MIYFSLIYIGTPYCLAGNTGFRVKNCGGPLKNSSSVTQLHTEFGPPQWVLNFFTNLQTLRGYSSDFSNTTKIRKDSEFAIALPESGMGASEIVNSDAFSGVRVRIFPHRRELYPVSGVHKMPGFGRSGPFESGRKGVEILVVRLFRPAGGLFFNEYLLF